MEDFAAFSLANYTIIAVFTIIIRFLTEKKERDVFKNGYSVEESLRRFQDLLKNYFPQNIVILNHSIDKVFFKNMKFINTFESSDIYKNNIAKLLSNLKYEKREQTSSHSGSHDFEKTIADENLSLFDILNRRMASKAWKDSQIKLFLSFTEDEESPKKTFEVTLFPFFWNGEEALTIILNDVTHQESLLAIKVADDNKDKVMSTISHELKTPLNALVGMIQVMEKEPKSRILSNYISICKTNAYLLLNMLNSILDIHQIRTRRIKLEMTEFNLHKLMHDIAILYGFQAEKKGLTLYLVMEDSMLPTHIYTDKNRLIEILINIINNAIKFTFEGGITIGVKTHPERLDKILFWVSDTGVGMKPENMKNLFKMFGKLEDANNSNTHGVGLGLSLSNKLVQLLNDNDKECGIEVQSELGKGSTFSFVLPNRSSDDSIFSVPEEVLENENNDSRTVPAAPFRSRSCVSIGTLGNLRLSNLFPQNFPSTITNTSTVLQANNTLKEMKDPGSPLPMVKFRKAESTPKLRWAGDINIMIVDDNPFNLLVVEKLILSQGYNVHTAYNGQQAIEKVKFLASHGEFLQLIFMDCQMPVMDGYEAASILKDMMKKKEIPEIPIIALSANDSQQDKQKCFKSGMDMFVSKPLQEKKLHDILLKYKLHSSFEG